MTQNAKFAAALSSLLLSIFTNTALGYNGWQCFNEARQHIIVVKGTGEPVQPEIKRRRKLDGQWEYKVDLKSFPGKTAKEQALKYDVYLKQIIDGINASPQQKLMFFIHGGMNYPTGAATHAAELLGLDKDRVREFNLSSQGYPIFICWASPPTGYAEQVAWVRAGKTERYGHSYTHRAYAIATLPFHFLADFGRGLVRFPAELSQFAHSDLYSISPKLFTDFATMCSEIRYIRGEAPSTGPDKHYISARENRIEVSSAPEIPTSPKRYLQDVETTLLFPIRTLTLPIIDSIGVGAWDNMLRHTGTMFDRTDTTRTPTPVEEAVELGQTGAIAMFFARLSSNEKLSKSHEIILITHSMGAIIGNRIIVSYAQLQLF